MPADQFNWLCTWDVHRWDEDAVAWLTTTLGRAPVAADFQAARIDPYSHSHIDGNQLLTAGLARVTSLIVGGGGQAYDNTHARIGVGNGSTAVAVGNTDLSAAAGSTNRWFQVMDATYPQTSAGVITFKATFGSADGNFAWSEFGIDNGVSPSSATVTAPLLNRKLSSQGTKTAGQSWTATATITIA